MNKIFLVQIQRPNTAPVNYFSQSALDVSGFITRNPDATIMVTSIERLPDGKSE